MPLPGSPVFFERNRVARVYRGGRLFHELFGDPAEDGLLPEEWIASTVRALNREGGDPLEGVSVVEGEELPLTRFLEDRPAALGGRGDLGILVKALDSAIRLPVQAHPDKAFARRHFRSIHGKTEMWVVLATRDEGAKIHFGFKEPVSRSRFADAVRESESDPAAMPSLLNEVPARPGDVYLIPPRVVHAIGAGCLILEVQEPTDLTLQPEAWCGDYRLSEREKYLGLHREAALECFDFEDVVGEKAISRGRMTPRLVERSDDGTVEDLVSFADTPDFAVRRHRVRRGASALGAGPSVIVVTAGAGTLAWRGVSRAIGKGSYFFQPADAADVEVATDGFVELIECLPPRL